MAHARRRIGSRSSVLRTALALLACGCASAPPTTAPRTAVRLEPLKAAAPERAPEPLPALPVLSGGAAIAERPHRVTSLSADNQDIGVVVRELAHQFGLQYRIEPGVRGIVNTTLRNKTLIEA